MHNPFEIGYQLFTTFYICGHNVPFVSGVWSGIESHLSSKSTFHAACVVRCKFPESA